MTTTTTPTSNLQTFLGPNPGLTRLYDNIQAEVPGVALEMVQMELWNTIEDFYLQSTERRQLVNWTMAPGVNHLDFNPYDENWLVGWVLQVVGLNNFTVEPPGGVLDLNYPANPRQGWVLLALKPVSFQADFPQTLFTNWFETILAGALARIYAKPMKPYTSPQLAQFNGKRYMAGVQRARGIADKQFTNGGGRWNFPNFAPGRRKN